MQNYQSIFVQLADKQASIWLNRPEKHNALNPLMIAELTEAFKRLSAETNTRIIVMRGKGKSFCAGADLNYMKEIAGFGEKENYADAMQLATLFETIYSSPKPVIALVHGAVYGGANGLSAACDIVLAEKETVFAFSEVKLGISPATISPYVIRRCGGAASRELMLTGRRFSAEEAARFLLVNKIVEHQEMEETLQSYVKELLAAAPEALAQCKKLIHDVNSQKKQGSELMAETAHLIASQRASAEGQEGIAAFFEKRKPNWNC
jgi:methylglutaconyl-CoA hydratase